MLIVKEMFVVKLFACAIMEEKYNINNEKKT